MISEEAWKKYKDLEYYPDKFCQRYGKNIRELIEKLKVFNLGNKNE